MMGLLAEGHAARAYLACWLENLTRRQFWAKLRRSSGQQQLALRGEAQAVLAAIVLNDGFLRPAKQIRRLEAGMLWAARWIIWHTRYRHRQGGGRPGQIRLRQHSRL
jgi:lambda repressor-like predicted transcriptional regulator